jgi:hypothetical protein
MLSMIHSLVSFESVPPKLPPTLIFRSNGILCSLRADRRDNSGVLIGHHMLDPETLEASSIIRRFVGDK